MKKYIIFAAAALVALAACSKVEVPETTPQREIGFQIANYSTQTKANETSLLNEKADGQDITSFTVNAWYHTGTEDAQQYMINQAVGYKAATTEPAADAMWAPTGRTYFWPKTGHINFFSYAGSPAADSVTEGTITYGSNTTAKTIDTDDNILVADAAYRFSENNTGTGAITSYHKNGVTEGVPTLFRHALAQVSLKAKFDASSVDDNKYKFEVDIQTLKINADDQGYVVFHFAEPEGTTKATAKMTETGVAWTPKAHYVDIPVPAANISAEKDLETVGGNAGEYTVFMDKFTVMPQNMVNDMGTTDDATDDKQATLTIKYKVTTIYNNDTEHAIHETIENTVPLNSFFVHNTTTPINAWNMNTRYTYNIILKPGGVVLFDPAVEAWEPGDAATTTVEKQFPAN